MIVSAVQYSTESVKDIREKSREEDFREFRYTDDY